MYEVIFMGILSADNNGAHMGNLRKSRIFANFAENVIADVDDEEVGWRGGYGRDDDIGGGVVGDGRCGAGARVTVEYGIEAALRVVPQKGMKQGVPGKITVRFSQDVSSVKNFREATDYQKLLYLNNTPAWYEHRTLTY